MSTDLMEITPMLMPLLVAAVLFPFNLLSYATAMHLVVQIAVKLIRSHQTTLGFRKSTIIMAKVTLFMAAAHLTQIALWAVVLLLCLHIPSFRTAFYLSAQVYTTLGYDDIHLSLQWRLLGPLEAMNGLLFFGLSTSVMFGALNQLMVLRLRAHTASQPEPADNGNPLALAANDRQGTRGILSIRALVRPGERI